jgi:hypothetical protein
MNAEVNVGSVLFAQSHKYNAILCAHLTHLGPLCRAGHDLLITFRQCPPKTLPLSSTNISSNRDIMSAVERSLSRGRESTLVCTNLKVEMFHHLIMPL